MASKLFNTTDDFFNYLTNQGYKNVDAIRNNYENNPTVKQLVDNTFIPSLESIAKSEQILNLQGAMGNNNLIAQAQANRNTINLNAARNNLSGGFVNQSLNQSDTSNARSLINLNTNIESQKQTLNMQKATLQENINTYLGNLK